MTPDQAQIVSAISALGQLIILSLTAWIAFYQLRNISHSLKLGQQGNTTNIVAHCASRYEKIMAESINLSREEDERIWWYRLWDLHTEQFMFFQKSLLDKDIYALWINELAINYNKPIKANGKTRVETHKEYLRDIIPYHKKLHEFFQQLEGISQEVSIAHKSQLVHELIEKFKPID